MTRKGTTWQQCQSESESEFESRNPNSNTHRLRPCYDCQLTVRMKHSLEVFATWQIDKSLVRFSIAALTSTSILAYCGKPHPSTHRHTYKPGYTPALVNKIPICSKTIWSEWNRAQEKNSTYQNDFELFMYKNWMKILQLEFEIHRLSSKNMLQIAYAMRGWLYTHTHTQINCNSVCTVWL